jgi:hypothetical protein
MVGGLAAGASALTGGSDEKAPAATPRLSRSAESGVTFTRRDHPCHRGQGHRAPSTSSDTEFRY